MELGEEASTLINQTFKNPTKLIVIGESKGAELVLLLGSAYSNEIDKIVGIVPSNHVFWGLGEMSVEVSSWTKKEQPFSYISLMKLRKEFHLSTIIPFAKYLLGMIRKKPVTFRKLYEQSVHLSDNKEEARIKSENFAGELLLIAGGQDMLWHSDQMAKEIKESRQPLKTELVIYEEAGHSIGGPHRTSKLILGGNEEISQRCYQDMMKNIVSFCST
ncbi:acyl-CoA thioester hydrolase/BAAT C-terminal domain-containing protein [Enterococcus sp. LJL51]|uniref:acyl-CoA thioester hydrolase/BAAT C-terminal domain-containing protein n=1 Tax=Enterococcus sp. LJL51 TaxID=3416656 RepID=UPI003CFB1EF7